MSAKTSWPQRVGVEHLLNATYLIAPDYVDEVECRLVADAAKKVHRMGGQFVGWPTITRQPLRLATTPEERAGLVGPPFIPCDLVEADYLHFRLEGEAIAR